MNQNNNTNHQDNSVPTIFGTAVNNSSNNIPQPNSNVIPTPPTGANLIEDIPVFDIPNFNDVPQVEPAIQTPVEPVTPSIENQVANAVPKTPEVVEELNPWVAAVEAAKEEQVVLPQEPKEPVAPKPMAPHTVEDLIASEQPVEPTPTKGKKQMPWKVIAIVGGILLVIILIVIGVAVLNKAGNKTLSCSLSDTNAGMRYRTTNTFVFKGKNMDTIGTKVEYIVADEADHTTELATLKAAVEFMDKTVKTRKGTRTKISSTSNSVTYDITLEPDKIQQSDWENTQEQFVDITSMEYLEKDYNTIKKEMDELGYTCK